MKKLFILLFVISVIIIMVNPVFSEDIKKPIDQAAIINIQGNIKAVMTSVQVPEAGAQGVPVAFIKVKIFDKNLNKEHFVQLAPGNFLRLQGLLLKKNDLVKIKGFAAQGSSELKSLAIEKDGRIFTLRDKFGRGLWNKSDLLRQEREIREKR